MGKYLSADDFIKGILGTEEDVEIEGLGTIRIRPLGQAESMRISASAKDDGERLVQFLAHAIVEPKLAPEQVAELYKALASKLEPMFERITLMAGQNAEVTDPLVGDGS